MAEILAIGFNLTEKERGQIGKLFLSCEIPLDKVEIIDCRTTGYSTIDTSVVVAFGKLAINGSKESAIKYGNLFIELPETKKLLPLPDGDKDAREQAISAIKDLKKAMDKGRLSLVDDKKLLESITEESIPDISTNKASKLIEILQQQGRNSWTGIGKNGKTVRISIKPEKDSTVDINITFDELYAIKAAMDIFKITEVQVGNSSTEDVTKDRRS